MSFASDKPTTRIMISKISLDSYIDAGVLVSIDLVNELALAHAYGKPAAEASPMTVLAHVLAIDPPSVKALKKRHAPGFIEFARRMRQVFAALHLDDVDAAADRINALLSAHPAHPYLAKEGGVWRLHHHPVDVALLPMWIAICAEAVARMIGTGNAHRLGTCDAVDCERVFFDGSKNATRRYCCTACQNRVKTAAFRLRQGSTNS
jgi:predicted RNA-binding Zn ribbon-like protein